MQKISKIIVSVDGPAGSGKQRIAKYIAKKYKLFHLDSGLLYRKIAYTIEEEKIKQTDLSSIKNLLKSIKVLTCKNNKKLRTEIISQTASKIAIFAFVRNFINKQQKLIVANISQNYNGAVIDGRDIGSKVFKDAKIKLFITVNPKIRAKRRHKQLIEIGEKSIYSQILKEINLRDKLDKNRKHSPLIRPRGSILIDNSFNFRKTILVINKIFKNI